jgi:hypothetical protein
MQENKIESIIVYSDSTMFPRGKFVTARYIWPILLKKYAHVVIIRGMGGITSTEIANLVKRDAMYFSLNEDSIDKIMVILAFGIVDAAPRPVTYKLKIVERVPIIGHYIWRTLALVLKPLRPRIQRYLRYQLINSAKFKENLLAIKNVISNTNCEIVLLETPMPTHFVLQRSPGLKEAIESLNQIKREFCIATGISMIKIPINPLKDYISQEDGHHFSIAGHKLVSDRIISHLNLTKL